MSPIYLIIEVIFFYIALLVATMIQIIVHQAKGKREIRDIFKQQATYISLILEILLQFSTYMIPDLEWG